MKVRETKLCNQINDMKTNSIDLENRFLNSESEIEKYKKEIHKESTEVMDKKLIFNQKTNSTINIYIF